MVNIKLPHFKKPTSISTNNIVYSPLNIFSASTFRSNCFLSAGDSARRYFLARCALCRRCSSLDASWQVAGHGGQDRSSTFVGSWVARRFSQCTLAMPRKRRFSGVSGPLRVIKPGCVSYVECDYSFTAAWQTTILVNFDTETVIGCYKRPL